MDVDTFDNKYLKDLCIVAIYYIAPSQHVVFPFKCKITSQNEFHSLDSKQNGFLSRVWHISCLCFFSSTEIMLQWQWLSGENLSSLTHLPTKAVDWHGWHEQVIVKKVVKFSFNSECYSQLLSHMSKGKLVPLLVEHSSDTQYTCRFCNLWVSQWDMEVVGDVGSTWTGRCTPAVTQEVTGLHKILTHFDRFDVRFLWQDMEWSNQKRQ